MIFEASMIAWHELLCALRHKKNTGYDANHVSTALKEVRNKLDEFALTVP